MRGGKKGFSGFQFPPPRGGEPTPFLAVGVGFDFNSRPREGANIDMDDLDNTDMLFQFPPPRGGERVFALLYEPDDPFQFPPPRGGERI